MRQNLINNHGPLTYCREHEEGADRQDETIVLPDDACPPAYDGVAEYDLRATKVNKQNVTD